MSTGLNCHAFVIGINAYEDGIAPLNSAVNDAQAVAEVLRSEHGYQVTCLLDEQATGQAIEEFLTRQLPVLLGTQSAFLFYFAGHGVALGDGTEGPDGYLLPQNARSAQVETWLSMDTLRDALEPLTCRHMLVVLDCCFAGAFRWASTRDAVLLGQPLFDSQFKRYLEGDAWQALTSAAHDQKAADVTPGRSNRRDVSAGVGHSPFADALIRGLSGAADSARGGHKPDGVITATELYQFLFEELMPQTQDSSQTPGIWPLKPGNRGEFVFLNPAAELNTTPDPPLDDSNNPWLGLRAYSSSESGLFFGRERVVTAIFERLLDPIATPLLAVVGASGTGKSSVVKAGVLPRLENHGEDSDADWAVVQAPRLGANPHDQFEPLLAGLATARATPNRLLLIDQFEELYTQCPDEESRNLFLQDLRTLIDEEEGLKVVITLRSDFEPRLASSEALGDLLSAARYLVPSFSVEETREIIEGPASVKAMYFDPAELVDELIEEVAAMPGALPLLSFGLAEMYRHAQRRRQDAGASDRALTRADFEAVGGVVGAVHKRATLLFEQSDAAAQQTIQRVFLRLLSQDGARLARRRVHTTELRYADQAEQQRVDQVVQRYVDARLLVVDGDFIEPAHDTLIVAWEQLLNWLASSGSQQLHRSLWRDASDWGEHSKASGFLWDSDPRLPQAEAALDELNALEQTFVSASRTRKSRLRRLLIGITASVIGTLSFATWFSIQQADEAKNQTRIAEEQLAQARFANGKVRLELGRQRLAERDYFSAAMLAGEAIGFRAYGSDRSPEMATRFPELVSPDKAEYVELIEVLSEAVIASFRPLAWRSVGQATFASHGEILASVSANNTLEVWRLGNGERIELEIPPSVEIASLTSSQDGSMLAAVNERDSQALLWHLTNPPGQRAAKILDIPAEQLRVSNNDGWSDSFSGESLDSLFAVEFSPDGRYLAGVGRDGVALWPTNPQPEDPLETTLAIAIDTQMGIHSVAFSADGKRLMLGGWQNRITQISIPDNHSNTDRLASRAVGPEWGWSRWSEHVQKGDNVTAMATDPEGRFLLIVSANQVLVGTAGNGGFSFDRDGPVFETSQRIEAMALTFDGRYVAVASTDGVQILTVPDLRTAADIDALSFSAARTSQLSFNADNTLLAISDGKSMELRDTSMLVAGGFEVSEADFPATITHAADLSTDLQLRIENDMLDLAAIVAAYTDPATAHDFIIGERNNELVLSFVDDKSLSFVPQPPAGELFAVGIDRFNGGGGQSLVDIYQASSNRQVLRFRTSEWQWGLDRFFFNENGTYLYAGFSNFDGYFSTGFRWPMMLPNLTVYIDPAACQAPINLPLESELAVSGLLDCATE